MRKLLLFLLTVAVLPSGNRSFAQTFAQIIDLAPATSVVNGVTVNISATGSNTTYFSGYCGLTAGPNQLPWIGQAGVGAYHYTFSTPVYGIRVRQVSLNVGEYVQMNTNGSMYFLLPAMAQSYINTCGEPFGYVQNGFFMPPSPYGQGEITITPGGISSFDLICQTGNSGIVFTVDIVFPDVAASNNGPICEGDTLELIGTASNPGLTWSWTGPGGFTCSQEDTMILNATMANAGMYYATATDGTNTWMDSTLVVINPVPNISSTSFLDPGPCNATDGSILLNGLLPNTAYTIDYLFNNNPGSGSGTSSNAGILTLNNLGAGVYSMITVTANGCTSPPVGPITLTEPPLVAPTIGSNSPVCENSPIILTASSYNNATYSWTGPNGFTSTTQNPVINNATLQADGIYTVVAGINGCVTPPASVTVIVKPLPQAPVTADLNYCQDDIVPALTAVGQDLLWYTVATGGAGAPSLVPPTNNPGNTTYYVTQTVNGCEGPRAPLNVLINATIDVNLTATRPTICIDDTVIITNTASGPVGSTYTWDFSGATIHSGAGNDPYLLSWNSYGDKTITLTVTDNICTTTENIRVFVDTPMHPNFDIFDHACVGEPVFLYQADYDGHNPPVYNWNFDGADVIRGDGLGAYELSWPNEGVKVITLDIPGICPEHFSDQLTVHVPPVAEIAGVSENPVCEGVPVQVTAVSKQEIYIYNWNNLDYHGFNNDSTIDATIKESGYITLTAIDKFGCATMDSMYVDVQPCCQVFVPSAFSPNGDGKNDLFRPRTAGFQHYTTFQIMNRWGQKIFESKNQNDGWDGTFNGEPQDPGTYSYYLLYSCGGNMTEKKGSVTLVK